LTIATDPLAMLSRTINRLMPGSPSRAVNGLATPMVGALRVLTTSSSF